jgi:hypothetical protein
MDLLPVNLCNIYEYYQEKAAHTQKETVCQKVGKFVDVLNPCLGYKLFMQAQINDCQ